MFSTLKQAFKDKNIRGRIFFTLWMLIVFRIGSHITVPFVNAGAVSTLANSGLFGLLNTFGGGALASYSIFSLGVSPYITASIVIQLLQMEIVPSFTEWSKQGEVGRRKLNKWTRYFAVAIAFFQSLALSLGFNSLAQFGLIQNPSTTTYLFIALIMTAGSMFVTWIGEQITQYGVGNGTSLIIFAGIVSRVPTEIVAFVSSKLLKVEGNALVQNGLLALAFILIMILIITFVVFINQAERRIPVRYSKRANSANQRAHLPLKINSAGVIPVIFASSLIMVPQTILNFFRASHGEAEWFKLVSRIFSLQDPLGITLYAVTIILFTFFYAHIQINPERVAENFQKSGAYIPSVRPGLATEQFISTVLNRLSFFGALFLMAIATAPLVLSYVLDMSQRVALSGTSLLIVVGVALDTYKQIEGRLIKHRYIGFIRE
ncbi:MULTISPECIES: preprotein translocase subunit SecY [Aerococcus]|uniref:Protein translocase subunit SecY n=2 Tax=Aerococcus TaxID=1375 RepID=A0A178HEY2_9LACT|nr:MULTISPECIES: preprotein translocase subunit SecY [Aerococcus]KAA9218912.1 preprotein translocase subunit SecY [Aerococcus loyolae]KAA9266100.1 preprotein translocase subunit SecY [Aerococcus loyolae]MCY3025791.1 preprotein translocase subunit SecY [Aerococcus loyolae]MCY3027642.1 preprotein translocase subunit SecY [Aerococcus loyolae]MCY3029685.1 preprotein translocase subunit SecY [Aerococcus loyolae]